MKNFFIKNKYTKSFTLVETLTAMAIIIMAILGPLTVAVYSFSYATETRDNITSTYLASEGIELLRYKRDSIYLNYLFKIGTIYTDPWNDFKNLFGDLSQNPKTGCYSPTGCNVDIFTIDSSPTYTTTCPSLYRDSTNYLYSCTGAINDRTSFSRNIKMEDVTNTIPNEDDIRVTSTVTYKKSNGLSRSVSITDFIHTR